MIIRQLESRDRPHLFAFWKEMAQQVPYFFPVTEAAWWQALTEEQHGLMGLHLLPGANWGWVAEEGEKILGFAHVGRPNVDLGSRGEVRERPTDVWVLRHLYCRPDAPAAGRALLDQALADRAPGERVYAFFHAHGMSCNAHHGKLHEGMPWIHDLLLQTGFTVEHENVYFSLDLTRAGAGLPTLELTETEPGAFQALHEGVPVGTARAEALGALTGGAAADTVYLRWMGVREELRGRGLGKRLLGALISHYGAASFRHMHLDTALSNTVAQALYRRVGFDDRGLTRSYQLD